MGIRVSRNASGNYIAVNADFFKLLGNREQAHTWLGQHEARRLSPVESADGVEGLYYIPTEVVVRKIK